MGSIISAIEESAYDEYCAECEAEGKQPDDWYVFRGRARQYIEERMLKKTSATQEVCKCDNDKYPSQWWINAGATYCGDCGRILQHPPTPRR